MLLRLYKENQPAILFILPLAALFFWIPVFIKPSSWCFSQADTPPLYNVVAEYLCGSKILSLSISLVLILTGALLLNYVCSRHEILLRPSNLPALFYITYSSFHEALLTFHPVLIASILVILALHRLFDTYRKETAYSQVFDAGMLISLATLFFFPSVIFLLVIFISLIIFHPFIWREWIITLMGFSLPLFLLFAGYYYFGRQELFFEYLDKISFKPKPFYFDISIWEYIIFALIFIFNFFAFWKLAPRLANSKLKTRKTYNFMLWVTFFIALVFICFPSFSILYFSFFAIPLSMLSSSFVLLQKKSWPSELLYYILLFFVIYGHIR